MQSIIEQLKVGDSVTFYLSCNADRKQLSGVVEHDESLGLYVSIGNFKIEMRKAVDIEKANHHKKPLMKQEVDTTPIKEIAQQYLDFVSSDEFHDDNDFDSHIVETVLEAYFGKEVWKYINSRN